MLINRRCSIGLSKYFLYPVPVTFQLYKKTFPLTMKFLGIYPIPSQSHSYIVLNSPPISLCNKIRRSVLLVDRRKYKVFQFFCHYVLLILCNMGIDWQHYLRANITTTYLGLLERNQKNPTVKVIEQLCCQFNISLGDFFSPSQAPKKPGDAVSMQILAQISDRTEDEKLLILQTIKDMMRLCDLSKKNAQNSIQADADMKKDNMP